MSTVGRIVPFALIIIQQLLITLSSFSVNLIEFVLARKTGLPSHNIAVLLFLYERRLVVRSGTIQFHIIATALRTPFHTFLNNSNNENI